MAARFGDGIRPELGATDFSGFLQGSAQGSAAIGQGIAKLGEGAGQFLGDIGQAKKDKAGAISLFTAAGNMTEDPKMKTFFESTVEKLETGTLREAAGISARAKEFMQFAGQSADRSMMKDSIFFDQKMAGKAHGLAVDKFGFLKSESGLDRAEGKEIREEQFADKRRAARDAAEREAQRVREWEATHGLKEKSHILDQRTVNTNEFAAEALAKAAAGAPAPLTPAEKKVQEGAGTEVAGWLAGGRAEYESTKKILQDVIDSGEIRKVNTGPFVGTLSKIPVAGSFATDKKELEAKINAIAMKGLKATLGAQFTQKEAERLLEGLFDVRAQSGANEKKLQRFIDGLDSKAKDLNALSKDISAHGEVQSGTIGGADPSNPFAGMSDDEILQWMLTRGIKEGGRGMLPAK